MSSLTSLRPGGTRLLTGLRGVLDPPLDVSLVDNTPRLLDALNRSDKLQKLLSKRDDRGFTLLHVAAEKNQPESLKCLLIKEANPNVRSSVSSHEMTPLHVAAQCGHLACLQLLVQSGGDVMLPDRKQCTAIDHANIHGQELCLNYLHEVVAKQQRDGTREVEDVLNEVERNLAADNVQTLNHWVQFNELFPLSVSEEATNDISQADCIINRHCALINQQNMVRVLGRISKDVPICLHDATLLHAACHHGRLELASLLLEKVPEVILDFTREGYNALHVAVAHQKTDVVRLLILKQIQWSKQRVHGLTSSAIDGSGIHEASISPRINVRLFVPTLTGHTVLHFAVANNDRETLSQLLKYRDLQLGVDANECGYTPLHLAIFLNLSEIAHMLLRRGANPNTRLEPSVLEKLTSISRTPLSEAVLNKSPNCLNLLLDFGAEDKYHDALNFSLHQNPDVVVPLLGSLIKADDLHKPSYKGGHKDRRAKMAAIDWSHLKLSSLPPSWIASSLPSALFLRSQNIEHSRLSEFVTTVNLSHNSLAWLPAEVFTLPNLTLLNVSHNHLEKLPEIDLIYDEKENSYRWPSVSLSKFILSRNWLISLPEFIFSLANLTHLDLSYNRLEKLPFDVWKAPKLHHLNCSHNELLTIPTNWPQVLDECVCINASPSPNHAPAATPTSTQTSPPLLSKTPSITKLAPPLKENKPAQASKGSGSGGGGTDSDKKEDSENAPISKLQDRLNICNGNLPVEWESGDPRDEVYEGLAILDLSHNQISGIPHNLPCLCPKLVRLDLSHNEIEEICLPRNFPSTLKHLNLSHNPIVEVNSQQMLALPLPCTNPQILYEANNSIVIDNTSFCQHRCHNQMVVLGVLELNNCQLEFVNLFTTQLASAKKDAKKQAKPTEAVNPTPSSGSKRPQGSSHSLARLVCPLLTRLILSHNQLQEVPESLCEIISLNSLDLSYNQIIDLPAELGNLCNLWEFPLTELKLISPPQNIIDRGKTKDIIGFLWSLLQKARPYHRMKLMLVGKAARGKTTLLERISDRGQRGRSRDWGTTRMLNLVPHRPPPPSAKEKKLSTVGIVVSDWTYYKKVKESQTSLKSITFMTWDFGGQEEYYATHQCFLSRRSLYLVIWNAGHGMVGVEELKPWLLNIQARAPHSPVIIVGTHLDKVSSRAQRQELQRCLDYIDVTYGMEEMRKEGFPQVMRNVVVSCKPGTGGSRLQELRDAIFDVASQVKENIVAGRGIGNGRIPEYRLLMDQLVPASYLQLEDTIRNLALNMRLAERPPVLTYKELRDAVFADPRTLINKQNSSRELEQAVRFLHDNGTMLHYEDPLLTDLYFVDPQWLCDMLAHVVTVREINPLVKDGVMRLKDFPLIFNDHEFPIRWQKEYIRLLTMFEVAVELGRGELLVPSALPQEKPNLPQTMIPDDMHRLPELRHTYIVPFIPSGFWPRLMSRLLTDGTLLHLAKEGCGLADDESSQLSWVKWRTGMILQYGNLTLLSIEELRKGMFPTASNLEGIKIYKDDQWKLHHKSIHIFGIDIIVPDIFPILKYPEAAAERRRKAKEQRTVRRAPNPPPSTLSASIRGGGAHEATPTTARGGGASRLSVPEITVESSQESVRSGDSQAALLSSSSESHDSQDGSHDALQPVPGGCANKVVSIDQIDSEFEKLARKRTRTHGNRSYNVMEEGGASEVGGASNLLLGNSLHRNASIGRRSRANSLEGNRLQPTPPPAPTEPRLFPTIDEELNDMMRAGLLSKSVDHISLLIEEWFTGVRPRTLVVPCPHCSADLPHRDVQLQRSFSNMPPLLSEEERRERATTLDQAQTQAQDWSDRLRPLREEQPKDLISVLQDKESSSHLRSPRTGRPVVPRPAVSSSGIGMGHSMNQNGSLELSQDPFYYAFQYNDCVVTARTQNTMFCPAHGNVALQYSAPDTLFLTQGKDVLLNPQDLEREESIGKGAYATVFKARVKKDEADGDVKHVALKALTKEWRLHDALSSRCNESDPKGSTAAQLSLIKPPSRHSIIEGFTNLKKELSILSPLKHTHIIRLYGIMLRPLGLVLELAPKGSLKAIFQSYSEAMRKPNGAVIQAVVVQVAKAVQYLHRSSIIYRDLKSDNVLVWEFPDPEDQVPTRAQLGMETVFVKLSDYGISQFAATQGARGLLGTPGFMAPEILKYHGKEVYTDSVDIFSFGMFIYELITLRIPYESLTAQQANQANERGTRPPLTRKDFPCPVLLRELMVWCWQQSPDNRPAAGDIIAGAQSEQFLRLLEGIRVNESGQVTAMCVRVSYPSAQRSYSRSTRLFSPPPPPHTSTPSLSSKSPVTSIDTQGSHDHSPSHVTSSCALPCVDEENTGANFDKITQDSGITTIDPSRFHSNNSETPPPKAELYGRYPRKMSHDRSRRSFSSTYSADEPRMKSPGCSMEPMSLGGFYDDDFGPAYEFWVASSNAHHCTAAVMEYNGRFLSLKDVEVGDSPVLAMCTVHDRVWMVFEIGCLVVYDAVTHEPLVQAWIKQHTRILCVTHLPSLARVYVGLEDGSVFAFPDDLSQYAYSSSRVTLQPLVEYQDTTQTAASLLAVPSSRGDGSFEIWVGQKSAMITVLDAETLSVVKFIQNKLDHSKVPSYVAYLSYAHLVLGAMSPDSHVIPPAVATKSASSQSVVSVYGAMFHGQYVTRWNADSKMAVESFNCQAFLGKEECAITSLHYSRSQLYVGLNTGRILVIDPVMCACVCELACHRSRVSHLTTLSMAALQDERCCLRFLPGTACGTSPVLPEEIHRSPSLSSVQSEPLQQPMGQQLLSCGSGFKSYVEGGVDARRHLDAGFLLVWEAESWNEELCTL